MSEPVESAQPDSNLFEPVLTSEHDTAGIHHPFNPIYFLFLAFFFGPLAAGIPLYLNTRRLGMRPSSGRWALVVGLLFGVAYLPIMIPLVEHLAKEADMDESYRETMAYLDRGGDAEGLVQEMERLVKVQQQSPTRSEEYRRYSRWLGQALSVLIMWPFVRLQRRRFELAQAHDLPAGKLLWPGLAGCVISMIVYFGTVVVIVLLRTQR